MAHAHHEGRLGVAVALVSGIVVAQVVGSLVTGSLAILVDAVHSLTDVVGLAVALAAAHLASRPARGARTWGFRRVEVLAALAQAVLLIGAAVFAIVEGVERWRQPADVRAGELLVFAAIGLALNLAAALALSSGRGANLNMRAAFLEVLMDALGTVAVAISAILMMTTGFARADVIAAFAIAAMILPRAGLLVRDAVRILMEFAPRGLDLDAVRAHLLAMEHIEDVHDLHASTVSTGLDTLSAHVVLDDACFRDGHAPELLDAMSACVAEHFDVPVTHTTFQLETAGHHGSEPELHP
ncbi:cation diffusion facilitator family transporter [Microbacterium indicum]|uniref:cation diffusion facilitator family transporter n=1 Tax=Microbacterium indicum TaxID=358100 RepID=UPI000405363F|nr:cation diffusion facilitator family transporter [Microbacterium indicum]